MQGTVDKSLQDLQREIGNYTSEFGDLSFKDQLACKRIWGAYDEVVEYVKMLSKRASSLSIDLSQEK